MNSDKENFVLERTRRKQNLHTVELHAENEYVLKMHNCSCNYHFLQWRLAFHV